VLESDLSPGGVPNRLGVDQDAVEIEDDGCYRYGRTP